MNLMLLDVAMPSLMDFLRIFSTESIAGIIVLLVLELLIAAVVVSCFVVKRASRNGDALPPEIDIETKEEEQE